MSDEHEHEHDEHEHGHEEHHHHAYDWQAELMEMRDATTHYYEHQFDWRGHEPPAGYQGPRFFPPTPDWRLVARLDTTAPGAGDHAEIATSTGQVRHMHIAGDLVFDKDNDVSIMNRAATEDLRTVQVWPIIRRVLNGGQAPSPLAAQAAKLIDQWRAGGSSRLDRNLDGKIDAPGAAVMDTAWNGIATTVMRPVLGPLTQNLEGQMGTSSTPSFGSGWYGYVSKDLRTELGMKVRGRFSHRYCGNGSLRACRASLWAAIQAAATQLKTTEGPNPKAWYSSATAERISFIPGLIPFTMRWTNRSTFQQVIEFTGHAKP